MTLDETFLIVGSAAPRLPDGMLQLGAFQSQTTVLGPGQRAVVWVAGCLRRCPGCIKPDLFSFSSGRPVAVVDLAREILSIPHLQGVTFSGGEPFEQADALGSLGRMLRPSGLDILVYTGYRRAALEAEPDRFKALLDVADFLIDGEYCQDLPGPFRWRGSSNQAFHDLRGQVAYELDSMSPCREIEVSVSDGGLRLVGFPSVEFVELLTQRMAQRGIQLTRVSRASVE